LLLGFCEEKKSRRKNPPGKTFKTDGLRSGHGEPWPPAEDPKTKNIIALQREILKKYKEILSFRNSVEKNKLFS
jgi:hypothetical protein|tara:strand:+ start:1773 stop:1994 length:222 start_codon:yes stop_codon:yes gene_type:complete